MRAVELHLTPEGGAFPGIDTALKAFDGVERKTLMNLEWQSDGTYSLVYRLSGSDVEALEELLDDHEQVRSYDVLPQSEDRLYVFIHLTERQLLSELLALTEEHGLLLETPFRFTEEGVRVTVAGDESALQAAYTEGNEVIDVDVESTGSYSPDEPEYLERMTDRQYEALETAYELGYYEPDTTVSFEEVADELDCAPSTANELLRRAEAALVAGVIGD